MGTEELNSKKNRRLKSADKQIGRSKYQKALDKYRRILQDNPYDTEMLLELAELQIQIGHPREAAVTLYRLGSVLSKGGHNLRAISSFNQVLQLDPECIDAHRYLADLNLKLGMKEEAKDHLTTLANYYDQQNDTLNALMVYRVLSDLDPTNVAILVKLAELCSSQDRLADAIQMFRRAAEVLKERGT